MSGLVCCTVSSPIPGGSRSPSLQAPFPTTLKRPPRPHCTHAACLVSEPECPLSLALDKPASLMHSADGEQVLNAPWGAAGGRGPDPRPQTKLRPTATRERQRLVLCIFQILCFYLTSQRQLIQQQQQQNGSLASF